MGDLGECVGDLRDTRLVIGGDFNAKSLLWSAACTNRRGELLERWSAVLDLHLVNVGGSPTCVRPQGNSIVDLTWCSSHAVNLIGGWSVLESVETLSDHVHIYFTLGSLARDESAARGRPAERRWNFKRMDEDLFQQTIAFSMSSAVDEAALEDVNVYERWLAEIVEEACSIAMPRVRALRGKRSAYWWSEELADLRRASIRARRGWFRARRRRDALDSAALARSYRAARRNLKIAIRRAKRACWTKLIATIDDDPWGLPYKLVMSKLRGSCPTMSQTLEAGELRRLLDSLFPYDGACEDYSRPVMPRTEDWNEEHDVTAAEICEFMTRRPNKNTAPGPDGIKFKAWKLVPDLAIGHVRELLTRCLRKGVFPGSWKRATLVLISKASSPTVGVKARPICLLNELGKIFERENHRSPHKRLDGRSSGGWSFRLSIRVSKESLYGGCALRGSRHRPSDDRRGRLRHRRKFRYSQRV